MIVSPPGDAVVRLEDLPRPREWPMPGLLRVVVCALFVAMFLVSIRMSETLTMWVGRKLQAGVIDNWNRPVQLLFLGWVAILFVMAIVLTVVELWNAGTREGALRDMGGWELWMRFRDRIRGGLPKGETVLAYAEVDHPDEAAPLFFERLFLILLVSSQVAALLVIQRIVAVDGYQAFLLWITFGVTSTLVACGAMLYCRPSSGFLVAMMVWTPLVHRLHYGLDPTSTGPALGLPVGALPLGLTALTLGTGAFVLASRRLRRLLLITDGGVRVLDIRGDTVQAYGKADPPLFVMATPTPVGARLQIGGSHGKDKIPPVRAAGNHVKTDLQVVIGRKLEGRNQIEGRDETSGIAGRLGEVPLLGWVFVALLVLVTQQALLPPVIGWLQVNTVIEAYAEQLADDRTEGLEETLASILADNPALGPAQSMYASVLLRSGRAAQAEEILQRLVSRREPWEDTPLVRQAGKMLEEARRAAASP